MNIRKRCKSQYTLENAKTLMWQMYYPEDLLLKDLHFCTLK